MKRGIVVVAMCLAVGVACADETPHFPGLLVQTKDGLVALPLERTRYEVELYGAVALVKRRQTWRCPLREPVDATYVSALPPDAALTGISISIGDRRAEGRLQPRAEAWARYRDAAAGGTRALYGETDEALVEETIANLRPGDVVEVELRYVSELRSLGDVAQLTLPLVAPPRRGRDGSSIATLRGPSPHPLPEAIAWTHRASLAVHAWLPAEATLESPSHALEVTRSASGIVARFRDGAQPADRDVVLRIHGSVPVVRAKTVGGSALAAQLTILPSLRTAAEEMQIVIDETALGSERVRAQAWATIAALVARARPGDRVVLVQAGRKIRRTVLGPHTDFAKLHSIEPGDLAEAIRADRAAPAKLPRAIVIVTDGALSDVARVGGAAADRVVVLTVGEATDGARAVQLAHNAGGVVVPAAPSDAANAIAERVERALTPALLEPHVRFEGALANATCAAPPRVLPAGTLTVLAVGGDDHGSGAIVVDGKTPAGGAVQARVEVPAAKEEPIVAAAIGAAYARARVANLPPEDSRGAELATQYGIASAWTSFVAVDSGTAGPPSAHLIAVPLPTPFAGPPEASGALSTDRIRPGDPEVVIEAPAGARRVTLLMPTGELKVCVYNAARDRWIASFLIDPDRHDGIYVVRVLIERADGTITRRLVRYEVDARAPEADVHLEPSVAAPGARIELVVVPRARPIVVDAARGDIGDATFASRVRTDVEAVLVRLPDGALREIARGNDGSYRLQLTAPAAPGTYSIAVTARDGARNGTRIVRTFDVR